MVQHGDLREPGETGRAPKPPQGAAAVGGGVDPAEFQEYFVQPARFTAGTATRYRPSIISAAPTYQHLAEGFVIGMRFHSAPVVRLADAKPVQLGHTVKADGRWRLFILAAAEPPAAPASRLRHLCQFLAESPIPPVRRHTPTGEDIDSVIDVRAVFQQSHARRVLRWIHHGAALTVTTPPDNARRMR